MSAAGTLGAAGAQHADAAGAQEPSVAATRHPGAALAVEVEQALPMPLAGAFNCRAGELLALVGPSGAGKTSLLRVIAGLMRPERGRVQVAGEVWCDTARGVFLPPQRRHVGLVFQSYALMPHRSAIDNVALALLHLPRNERLEQAGRWLERMRLTVAEAKRRPAQLSGGEQQRVALARALAREPRVLLLDEPFSAVDQMSRQALYELLADLRRELAIPIVLVTHDLAEARLLADTLVVIDAGRVLQQGSPAAIHRAPRNARVADLVGIRNRFAGEWLGPADRAGSGVLRWTSEAGDGAALPLLVVPDKGRIARGQRVAWVIPGEGIVVAPAGAPGAKDPRLAGVETPRPPDADAELAAVVEQARHLGEITLVTLALRVAPSLRLRMTMTGAAGARIAEGDEVSVALDLDRVHVMPLRLRAQPR